MSTPVSTSTSAVEVECASCGLIFGVDRETVAAGGRWMDCPACSPAPPPEPIGEAVMAETAG